MTGTKDVRSATASATLTVVNNRPPSASLNSVVASNGKVNPTSKLYISGTITDSRTSGNVTARWTVESGTLVDGKSLTMLASTPTTSTYYLSSKTAAIPVGLSLPSGKAISI